MGLKEEFQTIDSDKLADTLDSVFDQFVDLPTELGPTLEAAWAEYPILHELLMKIDNRLLDVDNWSDKEKRIAVVITALAFLAIREYCEAQEIDGQFPSVLESE